MTWVEAEAVGVDISTPDFEGHAEEMSAALDAMIKSVGQQLRDVPATPAQERVRRMAENDEPKCKNCACWVRLDTAGRPGNMGLCNLMGHENPVETDYSLIQPTTDLSLCSAWEPK